MEQFFLSSLSVFFLLPQFLLLSWRTEGSANEEEQVKAEKKGKQERKVVRRKREKPTVYVHVCSFVHTQKEGRVLMTVMKN